MQSEKGKQEDKMPEGSRVAFSRMCIRFLSKLDYGNYFSVATKIKIELFLEPYDITWH